MFSRKTLLTLLALLVISPIFGVILADILGYHEPLDLAAEELGLNESEFTWTPLKDYTIPNLPDWLGYILCGALGILIIVFIGFLIKTAIGR
ncbi:MAG: PDGLE domain-containing protein [Desulfurococcaceae archaeon TW002]